MTKPSHCVCFFCRRLGAALFRWHSCTWIHWTKALVRSLKPCLIHSERPESKCNQRSHGAPSTIMVTWKIHLMNWSNELILTHEVSTDSLLAKCQWAEWASEPHAAQPLIGHCCWCTSSQFAKRNKNNKKKKQLSHTHNLIQLRTFSPPFRSPSLFLCCSISLCDFGPSLRACRFDA